MLDRAYSVTLDYTQFFCYTSEYRPRCGGAEGDIMTVPPKRALKPLGRIEGPASAST